MGLRDRLFGSGGQEVPAEGGLTPEHHAEWNSFDAVMNTDGDRTEAMQESRQAYQAAGNELAVEQLEIYDSTNSYHGMASQELRQAIQAGDEEWQQEVLDDYYEKYPHQRPS